MRFLVVERMSHGVLSDKKEFERLAKADLEYKLKLQKKGRIVGGPFLDIIAAGYVLETETIEEMGEIFFNSPTNFAVEREVHPLGSFKDSLEGLSEMSKKK
ncbi:MAG: hypothetical protein OK438_05790 [Thaumarchaeota archaeon]|nr:hypothetical protein [Nitrososphaerota archaeon]